MFLVSMGFLVFLALFLAVYYLVPGKFQWYVLLAASLVFYFLAGTPFTVLYLLVTIVTVWAAGCAMEKLGNDQTKKKKVLIAALVINVGILAALKYANFFIVNFRKIYSLFGDGARIKEVQWIASLGVSFYTLMAVGYLLDVYWGISSAQKNVGKLALFLSFFPQMSSGPICRYRQMDHQLYEPHKFHYERLCAGIQRMMFGFVKKLVIAENLNPYVNYIFNDGADYNGWMIWGGMFLYMLQLYADFSGCMDIVLGASECFGIYMPENFNRPFHSRSIQEFWKRWHITLGLWLQDYIMYPVLRSAAWGKMYKKLKRRWGKKAAKNIPTFLAMLILWFYMGLWHGGAWHYVAEGIWFWCVIVAGQLLDKQLKGVMKFLHINEDSPWWHGFQSIRTTLIYGVGVIFFRAGSVRQALHYIKVGLSPRCLTIGNTTAQIKVYLSAFPINTGIKAAICVMIGILVVSLLILFQAKEKSVYQWLNGCNIVIRWGILYIILFTIILFGAYGPGFDASQFIYGGF